MKIIDYTFYRFYIHYKRLGYFASFSTILFFSIVCFSLMFPLVVVLLTIIDTEDKSYSIIILIYPIFIFIYLLKYYNKKKIEYIKKTYKKHPYNKKIKGWVFYMPVYSMIWFGLLGAVPAGRLANWILANWIK